MYLIDGVEKVVGWSSLRCKRHDIRVTAWSFRWQTNPAAESEVGIGGWPEQALAPMTSILDLKYQAALRLKALGIHSSGSKHRFASFPGRAYATKYPSLTIAQACVSPFCILVLLL